jgi:ABC-2 type transport system ATP-binding protein
VSEVLSVSALTKRYGAARSGEGRLALHEVSFRLNAGELVAVIGPNGAGKTTLLSIVAAVQSPSAGAVIRGARADMYAHDERAAAGIGWVPQSPALYTKLSVLENLELFARLEGVERPREAVTRMLEQTGLTARAHDPVGRLSGGNRQRVNVAIGLIADPPVLVLDEPSTALDPAQRERLWEFIAARAADGTTVLFSTHNVSEAQRYATRVLVLDDGRLLLDGPPQTLLARGGEGEQGDLERALVCFLRACARDARGEQAVKEGAP